MFAPQRRRYFEYMRKVLDLAGVPAEDHDAYRHIWNWEHVGKESTKDWDKRDWADALTALQRQLGEQPRRRSAPIRARGGDMATAPQIRAIRTIAKRITWTVRDGGLQGYLRLKALPSDLRRANWDGRLDGLFKSEASAAIAALNSLLAWQDQHAGTRGSASSVSDCGTGSGEGR